MTLEQHIDADFVTKMTGLPILVVGDVMLDRFVYGKVERISPESPVPVLSVLREVMMLGGAGNTLSNLSHLGCSGKILSVVGDDLDGEIVRDKAKELGIETLGLVISDDRPTSVKTRFLAGHQQLLRSDFENVRDVSSKIEDILLEKAKTLIYGVKVVVLSDYGKGVLTPRIIRGVIDLAKAQGIKVLVDPKGRDYNKYRGADIVTPNKKELSEASHGAKVDDDDQVTDAARRVIAGSGIGTVVATRSQDGMSVVTSNSALHIRSAADIQVFDVSGAGDSVIATLAASLAAGASLEAAAGLANIAGSIVVAKVGTAPIRAQELKDALSTSSHVADHNASNILEWADAAEEVRRWKARGQKVGFTNGCFDVLHFGHVNYLADARKKCDRLVVGLNKDASIRILKGETRPVHEEQARAGVLAGLAAVDMVVLFGAKKVEDDNTACALIELLQPDIYFKGGDYTIEQIPEAPTVMKAGGVVDVMPVYEGHSTTNSIKKIQGK